MEFFFRTATNNLDSKSQHSLRDRKGSCFVLSLFQKFTHTTTIKIFWFGKRTLSDIFSLKKRNQILRGSMTVEAALTLPIFLFCMMNILFSFRMIETQSRLLAAAHQVGNRICFYGYGEKYLPEGIPEAVTSALFSEGYARTAVISEVGTKFIKNSSITGGAAGLSFLGSSIMSHDDLVELQISWWARPFASGQGFKGFLMKTGYYGRAWTGYDAAMGAGDTEKEETMVYITEHGTVYHLKRDCYHLSPTIIMTSSGDVSSRRNNSGARYTACAYCVRGGMQMVCYITPEGTKYHNDPNCSGLKRTIYTVKLSEVGGRAACSNCGR